jgi:hypothetical protein
VNTQTVMNGPDPVISKLELRPAKCIFLKGADYLDFFVDGLSLWDRLSGWNRAFGYDGFSHEDWKTKIKPSVASRLGYGSVEEQQAVVQEMLLHSQPPHNQTRCRIYGCPDCPCFAVTAVIQRVDDLFVWRDFRSGGAAFRETPEMDGGPFFFNQTNYTRVFLSAS